ncbi:hypothetical protein RM697_10515 [Ichthyenterobacterium sp. W332]|uniref:Tetratricopeptide repeat protein n=1 Tax=Microcosmobacter mediterraneus TaxID=3075607 RepID=A0ABU2YLP6_9FLAO|nr:hypothetical protein [Ichthyenterobacterium sp. W332]MDT0559084.1 hypothetical protein [Ichthyenterobacterium sp. W332]
MKQIIIAFTILYIPILSSAQTLNHEITNDEETPFLLGKIDKKGLEGEHYKTWFSANYNAYDPNTNTIKILKEKGLNNYNILLFLGTWCGDSKKEVPRLFKVLEDSNFRMDQLTVIALSRKRNMYKQSPEHYEAGLNIHRVPTAIFYKDGKEVNRIVEHPIDSYEKDIENIITKNTYKPNYQIVSEINDILKNEGLNGLQKKTKKLLKRYDGKVSSMFELNTYGRILYGIGEIEEALTVFRLNTKLFSDQPRTYMSLANTLGISGNKDKAIKTLTKAIKLHPDNQDLIENLNRIKSN